MGIQQCRAAVVCPQIDATGLADTARYALLTGKTACRLPFPVHYRPYLSETTLSPTGC